MKSKERLRAFYLVLKKYFRKEVKSANSIKPLLQMSAFDRVLIENHDDRQHGITKLGNHKIRYGNPFGLLHSYDEIFEDNIYYFESVNPSPLIVDCGSNIGLSVLYFKTLFPLSQVIAFEPDPVLFETLKYNLKRVDNVELHQEAVWIRDEELSFETDASLSGHLTSGEEGLNKTTVRVKAIRLRDIIEQHEVIDFLKIDIEFAELKVIEDLGSTLSRVKNLFLEFHNIGGRYSADLSKILLVLEAAGFRYYIREAFDFAEYPFTNKAKEQMKENANYFNIFAVNVE